MLIASKRLLWETAICSYCCGAVAKRCSRQRTRCVTSVAICFPYASLLIPIEHRTKRHCHTITEMHSFYKVAVLLHKLTFYVERATRWVSIWINFVSVELLRIIHSTRGLVGVCKASAKLQSSSKFIRIKKHKEKRTGQKKF